MVRQAGGGELEKGYWLLEHMRDFVTMRRPETVLLGEIDTDPEKYVEYFGDEADRVTLLLDFWTNNHLFLDLARQQAEPLVRRSEEHTSELQSLMRISYAVFCLQKKKHQSATSHA